MSPTTLRILGIAGSLRDRSYNRALLRACVERQPPGVEIRPFDLRPVPPYNGDLDNDANRPEGVTRLKESLKSADALLIVTPEYNYGMPGVLKNALDWASRPAFRSPMAGLPVGLMGASPGGFGTARSQEQVKVALLAMVSEVFPHRSVAVPRCADKFDDELKLTDDATIEFVSKYLDSFAEWVRARRD